MLERDLHRLVVDYLLGPYSRHHGQRMRQFGALPETAVLNHAPNEGKRGWHSRGMLKTHGVQAGWPDLEILHLGRTVFIELKSERGRLIHSQKAMHAQLRDAGFPVHVARSLEEVQTILELEGFHLRAKAAA